MQGHCHHKAIMRLDAERDVLATMGLDVEILESGLLRDGRRLRLRSARSTTCRCAAGSACSCRGCARRPAQALIVADGFSCRTQIAQGSDRGALHLAEVLQMAIADDGGHAASAPYVESQYVTQVEAGLRLPMRRAKLVALLVALAVALLLLALLVVSARGIGP